MTPKEQLIEALRALCNSTEGGHAAVAAKTHSSAASIKQILDGVPLPSGNPRGVGPELQRRLSQHYPGWSGGQWAPPGSGAQPVSQSAVKVSPPTIKWGEKMKDELPPVFEVHVPDDALADKGVKAGDLVKFDTTIEPRGGDGVLVMDKTGEWYFRLYQQGLSGSWQAVTPNQFYPSLDSKKHGLILLAVLVGVQARWG